MKFKDFPYERPQLSEVLAKAETIAQNIENAKSADEVLDGIKENTASVRNTKVYLLSALFNAVSTLDNHYTLRVNHDLYGGE